MSFSSEIKEKISKISNECDSCDMAQLVAIVRFAGRITKDSVILNTENKWVAECIKRLIYKCLGVKTQAKYTKNTRLYEIVIDDNTACQTLFDVLMLKGDEEESLFCLECCMGAYARGAFLGGGSIIDPHKSYHLEFDARYESEALKLKKLFSNVMIESKITSRKGHFIVYVKEYSAIADVLGLIGATNAALDIYNISIEKEVRNSINRQMNCENANMDKIADAYKKHLAAIEKVRKTIGLSKLPDVLQEIARVRVEYPEDSLKELGQRLDTPIGKSGVNHRLNRIVAIADELK